MDSVDLDAQAEAMQERTLCPTCGHHTLVPLSEIYKSYAEYLEAVKNARHNTAVINTQHTRNS